MLAAKFRFHGRKSLNYLFKQGKVVRRKSVSLRFVKRQHSSNSRCAVVVGRKVTKLAPKRNKIRRRIYEIIRKNWLNLKPGYDMAFFVYDSDIAIAPHEDLEETISQLLEDAGILENNH